MKWKGEVFIFSNQSQTEAQRSHELGRGPTVSSSCDPTTEAVPHRFSDILTQPSCSSGLQNYRLTSAPAGFIA